MDKTEAREILRSEVEALRRQSYEELRGRMPDVIRRRFWFIEVLGDEQAETHDVAGRSGTVYQVETQVHWDGKPGEDIRVIASIDDGGWRSFSPMSDSFIVAPDGRFVGE